MRNTKYGSYIQGLRETLEELGQEVPEECTEENCPSIAEQYLDTIEYMRGQLRATIKVLKAKLEGT